MGNSDHGLSILIPVFNHAVLPLVRELLAQLSDWPGPVEICCLDDGSAEEYRRQNCPLAALPGVRYEELPANVGRSAARNRLAAGARHEWLLLLDNDGRLPDAQFLRRYAEARHRAPVLEGGVSYASVPPAEPTLQLRYRYATAREARPAVVRNQNPYSQLMLNNLLLKADIYRRFPLNEQLRHYGHEDTQLGWNLRQAAVPVLHLDNPVRHDEGLDPAAVFLAKSQHAVRNLVQLYRAQGLGLDSRLLRLALRLRRLQLAGATEKLLAAAEARLHRNLLSADPDLGQFDLLRLRWTLAELRQQGGGRR